LFDGLITFFTAALYPAWAPADVSSGEPGPDAALE
jgi:hypothetical protein